MSTLAVELDPDVIDVLVDNDLLRLTLADGRELAAPLAWFPRLLAANASARADWRLIGAARGCIGLRSTRTSPYRRCCAPADQPCGSSSLAVVPSSLEVKRSWKPCISATAATRLSPSPWPGVPEWRLAR